MEWLTQNWAWILILGFVGMLFVGRGSHGKKNVHTDKTPTRQEHQH